VIEAALAHSDKNEVRGAYNRAEYLERRKGLMVWWSDQISYASNETIEPSNNVEYLSPSFNKKM
jgi:hypothetical protein